MLCKWTPFRTGNTVEDLVAKCAMSAKWTSSFGSYLLRPTSPTGVTIRRTRAYGTESNATRFEPVLASD